jgi:hypothetical protein
MLLEKTCRSKSGVDALPPLARDCVRNRAAAGQVILGGKPACFRWRMFTVFVFFFRRMILCGN